MGTAFARGTESPVTARLTITAGRSPKRLDRSGDSDSSRFLAAGAARAWWVRTEQGRLAEAMPTIRRKLAGCENAILESNSILKFLRPDLYLTVLDPATADFKKSAQEFLDRADAVILHESAAQSRHGRRFR